ncbi:unnamed protein product [Timema podura]|uniref:Serpin domain-containing protein n=1 Tax=Timema podura TaxID=61482 RepID=A0ABN7NIM8_TIMPD|nr:unnamed protein product [Timema podura]
MQGLVYALLLPLAFVNGSSWRYINKVDPYSKDDIMFPSDRTSPFNEKFVNTGQDLHKKYQVAVEAIYGVAVRLKVFSPSLQSNEDKFPINDLVHKTKISGRRVRCADFMTLSITKMLALSSPTCSQLGVGLARLLADVMELFMDVLDTTNFLVSPLSVATAIGELLLGAQGQSRERLEWLLSTGSNQTVSGDPFELHRCGEIFRAVGCDGVGALVSNLRSDPASRNRSRQKYLLFEQVLPDSKGSCMCRLLSPPSYDPSHAKLEPSNCWQLGGLVQLLQADPKQHYDGYTLEFASAFFVQPDIKIKPSYEHAIKTLYGVQVLPLNFSGDPEYAQNTINQWTSVQTKGKIQSVLPTPLPPGTSTILVNTVYFKSDWEMPFDPELTIPGLFHVTQDRDVKVQLMRGHFDLLYADSERLGCRLVALPYKKSEAAMFIVLPYNHLGNKTYNIQQYMNTILVEDIINLISSAVLTPVTLALPKMTLKDVLSISEAVGKVRSKLNESDPPIKDVSSKRHQRRSTQYWREYRKSYYKLSGVSSDLRFRVDDILHQVVMEVSESGTEAAAVTAGTIDYIGGGKVFKVDSPFFFFIRHEATLASLFWGMIVDPTNGQGEYT